MTRLVVTGALAGLVVGYVLQRTDLCFHAAWRGLLDGHRHVVRVWIGGVALASVGLAVVYGADRWTQLNQGLALRPQGNVLGGLLIGVGMVVAASCTSGLFYKLGSGMLGAAVGLAGWAVGDIAGNRLLVGRDGGLDLRGTVVEVGDGPTIPEVLGVDRGVAAVVFLAVVAAGLWRWRGRAGDRAHWSWWVGALALGAATTGAWALAGVGGAPFGPSTVGGAATLVSGGPVEWWLVAFLAALAGGALVAAAVSRTLWVRGEVPTRYAGLAAGGLLLGVGGQVGGGCNLGHGLSGVAQMNLSSWLVVAAIVAGIAGARAVQRRLVARPTEGWTVGAGPR